MLNVQDRRKYTRSVRPLVPRSPEEQLALYARGPDELEAALAGLSREDLDQARFGQWTIRQIVEHVVADDARWTMCMQVAVARPGYTYGHEWFSGKRTEPWAGLWDGREHAIAPLVTLLRANRTHMLAVLHQRPEAWNRYVQFTRAAEQEAQTLTVGHMIWLQATHALEHIDEIRQARRMNRG
jgi:DinB superfamily